MSMPTSAVRGYRASRAPLASTSLDLLDRSRASLLQACRTGDAGERYVEAAPIIGWIALGQGLSGMYLMVTNYVFYSRRTGILAITTMASAVVGISALLLLVPRYGLMGAAIAFCIGMGVRFVLTWWASHLRHPMPWLAALRPGAG